jgi:hypothetical protein
LRHDLHQAISWSKASRLSVRTFKDVGDNKAVCILAHLQAKVAIERGRRLGFGTAIFGGRPGGQPDIDLELASLSLDPEPTLGARTGVGDGAREVVHGGDHAVIIKPGSRPPA